MTESGFLDKVLHLLGVSAEAIEEDEEPTVAAGRSGRQESAGQRSRQKTNLVSIAGARGGHNRVVVMEPRSFDEAQSVADQIRSGKPVIVRMDEVDRALARRLVDFLSGTVYALDGSVQKIGENIMLFAPANVVIQTDENTALRDRGSFAWDVSGGQKGEGEE